MANENHAEMRDEFWKLPPEALVDRATVAAVRYVSIATVAGEAIKGVGPQYTLIGNRALYRKADVLAWIESMSRVV